MPRSTSWPVWTDSSTGPSLTFCGASSLSPRRPQAARRSFSGTPMVKANRSRVPNTLATTGILLSPTRPEHSTGDWPRCSSSMATAVISYSSDTLSLMWRMLTGSVCSTALRYSRRLRPDFLDAAGLLCVLLIVIPGWRLRFHDLVEDPVVEGVAECFHVREL